MVKKICQRVDATGSATERKAGSGRPKSARSVTNSECVEDQRPVASKFTRLEPLGLPCLGTMLEASHKRHPKPKTIAELKEVLQVIWDRSGTNRQSCQRVLKATEGLCCS